MVKSISDKIMLLLALIALVGFVGCSNETFKSSDAEEDDDYESSMPDSYVPDEGSVQFSTLVWSDSETKSAATRGVVTEDFEVGDEVGIYAYRVPSDGSVDPLDSSPNFMHNQKLTMFSEDTWFYTPTKYWSNDATDQYIFFGYSPYSEDEENTMYHSSVNQTIKYPVIVHSSPLEIADSRDLVLAGRKCSKYDAAGDLTVVDLIFEHALSRLRFEFRNDLYAEEKTYSMVVTGIRLRNATTQSAFTYQDDENSSTGLLLVEYLADEVQGTGTISGTIKSGALMGAGDDANGYSKDEAYIPYYDLNINPDKYNTYTPLMPADTYLFLDPYVIGTTKVWLELDVEVYAADTMASSGWTLALSNTASLEVTDVVSSMSRGGSYVWQISYMPIPGSALMVYVIEYWDDVYNKHDM